MIVLTDEQREAIDAVARDLAAHRQCTFEGARGLVMSAANNAPLELAAARAMLEFGRQWFSRRHAPVPYKRNKRRYGR